MSDKLLAEMTEAPDVVERVAKAIYDATLSYLNVDAPGPGDVSDAQEFALIAARAALAAMPAGAEGYCLVPTDPTVEMLEAASRELPGITAMYWAMLRAAPIPPAAPQGEHDEAHERVRPLA